MILEPKVGMTVLLYQSRDMAPEPGIITRVGVEGVLDLQIIHSESFAVMPVSGVPHLDSERAEYVFSHVDPEVGGAWDYTEHDKTIAAFLTPATPEQLVGHAPKRGRPPKVKDAEPAV